MKLRELQKEFKKKGIKYTQLLKKVKEYVNESGEITKDGIVIYKCLNFEYNDEYFEVFRYRIAKPHPNDTNGWDMVELYPSDESFGSWAWCCSDRHCVQKILDKHFDEEYIAEIHI